jgi:O-antigen ligase
MHKLVLENKVWQFTALIVFAALGVLFGRLAENPLVFVVATAGVLFLLAFVLAAYWGVWTARRVSLLLWIILLTHRVLNPRVASVEVANIAWDPLTVTEALVTLVIFIPSLALFLWRFRNLRFDGVPTTLRFLGLYALVAGCSLLYTPAFFYAGFWLLRLASAVLLLAVYCESASTREITWLANVTFLSMIPYILLPGIAFLQNPVVLFGRVSGSWVHPDQVSVIGYAVAVACFLKWLLGAGRSGWLALAFVSLASAFVGAGKAAAVFMVVVSVFVFLSTWRRWFSLRVAAGLAVLGVGIALLAVHAEVGLLAHWQTYPQEGYGTIGGRVELWQRTLSIWLNSPFLGQGFASTRFVIPAFSMWTSDPGHVHNSFLQPLVEVGLLGSAPLFVAIGIVLFRTMRLGLGVFRSKDLGPLAAAWYVLLFCGFTGLVFGGLLQPESYLFLGLLVAIDMLTRRRGRISGGRPAVE